MAHSNLQRCSDDDQAPIRVVLGARQCVNRTQNECHFLPKCLWRALRWAIAFLSAFTANAAWAADASSCARNGGSTECEPKAYYWGSSGYGIPEIYPSFGAIFGARIGPVLATTGPGAVPIFGPRTGARCNNCTTDFTQLYSATWGRVSGERKTPPGSYYDYVRHGQFVSASKSCRTGWSATSGSSANFCTRSGRDSDKDTGAPPDCRGAGNPIDPGTGNKYEVATDYEGAGSNALVFRRYYSSNSRAYGSLGNLWRSSYDRDVVALDTAGNDAAVMVRRHDGRGIVFTFWGGSWQTAADISDRLTQVFDGTTPNGWRYYDSAAQSTEIYDRDGRLIRITAHTGLTTLLTYSDAATEIAVAPRPGLLVSVTDPYGRQLKLTWNAQQRIATMTDPAGGVYRYYYSIGGNLISATYPDDTPTDDTDNPNRTYHYENATCKQALTGITDENAVRFSTYGYDANCRATSTQHAGGVNRVSVSYGNRSSVITDALGTERTMKFETLHGVTRTRSQTQPCAACGGAGASSNTFDDNGNIATRIDFNGNRTHYTFDLTRNLQTKRVEGLTAEGSSTAATRTITTAWHETLRLPVRIAEPKRITTLDYDSNGHLVSRSIQATTDLTGAFGFGATPNGVAHTWTYVHTYSSSVPGLILQTVIDGPRTDVTDVTTLAWDSTGNLVRSTNALGHTTTHEAYDAHGRVQRITDPNGVVTALSYDARGRLLTRAIAGEVTRYEYDRTGQLKKVIAPDTSFMAYTYDDAHRLTQIQDNLGSKIVYTLDLVGNRIKEDVSNAANDLVQRRAREYNNLNRLIKAIGGASPTSQITQYDYDRQGNLTSLTDAMGKITAYRYDALNRLVAQVDPAAGDAGAGGTTAYALDGLNQTMSVTDPRGLVTGYSVNGLGQVIAHASPDSGGSTSRFDSAGNRVGHTDARAVETVLTYDALNRVTQVTWSPPAGSSMTSVTQDYTYDTGSNAQGKLTSVTDPSGTTTYTYSVKGRVARETRTIAGVSYTTAYGYDRYGRLSSTTYPSGRVVRYKFDALGQVTRIDTNAPGGASKVVVKDVTYLPFGGIKGFAFGNNAPYERRYDLDGRVSGYTLGSLSRNLGFDAASRISAFTHNDTAYDQTFGYDNLNRLTRWTGLATSQGFTYDAVHNRTSQSIGASTYRYSVSDSANRLTQVSGPVARAYTYDAAGNVTRDSGRSFSYDARGRMIQAKRGTHTTTYAVNSLGQRVLKTPAGGSATVYHYDQTGLLIAESNAAGNPQREYIYLGKIPVALINASAPATLFNLFTDHLNTVRVITSPSNTVRWRWDSDPFGTTPANTNPSGVGNFNFNLRFPGQYRDTETGIHYNYFRDYDPFIGRYIQSDPIGLAGGINTFAYVWGNPLSFGDPSGLDVTVARYPGAGGFGHVGVGVNTASTTGFYPSPTASNWNVITGQPVPGVMLPDTRTPIETITIPTTPSQDRSIQEYITRRTANPGIYDLNDRNCTTTVREALRAGGVNTPDTIFPHVLLDHLKRQVPSQQNWP